MEDPEKGPTERQRRDTDLRRVLRGLGEAISAAAVDLDAVFKTIVENAVTLCDAESSTLAVGDEATGYRIVAAAGHFDEAHALFMWAPSRKPGRDSITGRVLLERRTVQIEDVRADAEFRSLDGREARVDYPSPMRTLLAVPVRQGGRILGVIQALRHEVRPFDERETETLEIFADQAAIAIENSRLVSETREGLHREAAQAAVLRAIASSPRDVTPVLAAIAENAARFTGAEDARVRLVRDGQLVWFAHHGPLVPRLASTPVPIDRDSCSGVAVLEKRTVYVRDILGPDGDLFPGTRATVVQSRAGIRSHLVAPLMKQGAAIGVIVLRKTAPDGFTQKQIELIETFANQAVIAIENVRLFNETKEALDRQTATAEVLKIISRSAFDLRAIFAVAVEKAVALCNADHGWIIRIEPDGRGRYEAYQGDNDELRAYTDADEFLLPASVEDTRSISRRAELQRQIVHVRDIEQEPDVLGPRLRAIQARTALAVPLLTSDRVVGVFVLARTRQQPFSDAEIELLRTFGDQAAIAIENARLIGEIRDKSDQLEAASRHKSEFLANMSHELRTPLNAVIGFSDVLEQRLFGDLNERQADYVKDIATSGRHLLDLVNEILDLSKVEAGKMELEFAEFALGETIHAALALVREGATGHAIKLSADIPEGLGTLVADERKVRQVLLNLLSNAVKFTPDGGQVVLTARRAEGEIHISVRDTGIGIAPEDQRKVFEEFRQVGRATQRSREGTGLGLALAKRFVELHGGRIWFESELGNGTTFTFALPTRAAVATV